MMSEWTKELTKRLVVGHTRDGRCIYDEQAKRELILACREPGASVSKLARDCGVNANQLSTWARKFELAAAKTAAAPASSGTAVTQAAFVAGDNDDEPVGARSGGVDRPARMRHASGTGPARCAGEAAVFRFDEGLKVYLHREAIDFRVGLNG